MDSFLVRNSIYGCMMMQVYMRAHEDIAFVSANYESSSDLIRVVRYNST